MERFHEEKSDLIKRPFQRSSIALPPDGPQDDEISVQDVVGYIGSQIRDLERRKSRLNSNLTKAQKVGPGIAEEGGD